MIFVEFTVGQDTDTGRKGEKVYFVGTDWESIANDTKSGTEFGGTLFSSHKEVSQNHAIENGMKENAVAQAIDFVRKGCPSFMLGTAPKVLA